MERSKVERAAAADGYFKLGAAYWPGAAHFSLVDLDRHANSIDARPVYRACVR